MIVYRICNESYKDDISGNGAAINGSRWNSKNIRMLYTGQYISLSILESLVHLREIDLPEKQFLLMIEVSSSRSSIFAFKFLNSMTSLSSESSDQ